MALISFFRLPKNKRFDIIPRYWDPAKEELQERISAIEKEMGVTKEEDNQVYRPNIKGKMVRHYRGAARAESKYSNLRLIVIIFALLFVSWLILFR